MNNMKKELNRQLAEIGIYKKIYVDNETTREYHQNTEAIPEDVYYEEVPEFFGRFYRIEECDLTADERRDLILSKIYEEAEETKQYSKTTKNCMVFFTTITVISLILSFLVFMISIS